MKRLAVWQMAGIVYVAAVCAVAVPALAGGGTYRTYLLLLCVTMPLGALIPAMAELIAVGLAVVFGVSPDGGPSALSTAMFVAGFGAAATANVFLARVAWLSSRGCRSRCRLLFARA